MDIDLSQELVYKVKLPGNKVVELREPTTDDIELMTNVDKDDPKASNNAFRAFVMALGMPEADLNSIGVVRLKTLAEGLMKPLSEKKSEG